MKKSGKKEKIESKDSAVDAELLRRSRISFLVASGLVIIFAVSYGCLEYYYINDPVQ